MNLTLLTALAPLVPLTRTVLTGAIAARLTREFHLWLWKRQWRMHRQKPYEASVRAADAMASAPVLASRRYRPIQPAAITRPLRVKSPAR
jgi:hypothetical protein